MENITVCIPTYKTNIENLKKTIESIIDQDYNNFKVLISENFPKDKKVETYIDSVKQNLNIEYFRQEKFLSQNENWDFLLNKVTSKYCMVLGDDDKISKNYLSSAIKILDDDKDIYGVTSQWLHRIDDGKEFVAGGAQHSYLSKNPILRIIKFIFNHNDVYVIAVMRTEIVKKIGWKKSNKAYWWPNKDEIANSLTPFIFGCLYLGKGYFNSKTTYYHNSITWPRNKENLNVNKFLINNIKGLLRYLNLYFFFMITLFRLNKFALPIIAPFAILALIKVYYFLLKKFIRKLFRHCFKNEKLY